ncbi:MAG TPA: PadR family transcriptional regulator [Miltoncostaeaceae bacterium]|nr:PadR family transcriptional regulator [Miltoncostaeaceae bacterium]
MTTYAVLGQLAGGPSSGYEIKARLEAGAAQFWHASYSQIYSELRRLAELGLAGEEHVRQDARPNKRVYTITPAGRRALRAWLEEPWGLATLRDESLVKLTLAEGLPDAEVAARLRGLKAAHERRCAEFEEEIAGLSPTADRYLVLALRKGVHAQRAFARWCQEAIDALDADG